MKGRLRIMTQRCFALETKVLVGRSRPLRGQGRSLRRSDWLAKCLATAEKRVSDLHQELKECGLAIDAASKQATAAQNRTAPNA